MILVINMIDESDALGIAIDTEKLERHLRMPVIPVSAVKNLGMTF